jgi:hypothetical protein
MSASPTATTRMCVFWVGLEQMEGLAGLPQLEAVMRRMLWEVPALACVLRIVSACVLRTDLTYPSFSGPFPQGRGVAILHCGAPAAGMNGYGSGGQSLFAIAG